MSNSPQDKPASKNPSQPDIEFTTSNIGRWASKQENPFAEQNRKTAAKKQARAEKRKKARPIAVIVISALAVAAAIWGLVVLIDTLISNTDFTDYSTPEIAGSSAEDINQYRKILDKFYNRYPNASNDEKYQEVDRVVNETIEKADTEEEKTAARLALMNFCMDTGCYQQAIDSAQYIDESKLPSGQQVSYYNMLANCYYWLGHHDKANEYYNLQYNVQEDYGENE